jgi:hypothetical protein
MAKGVAHRQAEQQAFYAPIGPQIVQVHRRRDSIEYGPPAEGGQPLGKHFVKHLAGVW